MVTITNPVEEPGTTPPELEDRPCRYFSKCGNFVTAPVDSFAWCEQCATRHLYQVVEKYGEDTEEYRAAERLNALYAFGNGEEDPRQNI